MGKVEKISLNEKQMELVTYYSENDMARLKRICNPIINMKNVDQKDYDDLYSDALKVLLESVQTFDETADCSFNTFLTGNIKRSFYDWSRDQLTWKRCNLEYETDENGEIKKDKNGKPIKKKVYDVSMDVPLEDGSDLREKIPSNFSVETELGLNGDDSVEKVNILLDSMPRLQKRITILKMRKVPVEKIKKILDISQSDYENAVERIKRNENMEMFLKDTKYNMEEYDMKDRVIAISESEDYRMDKLPMFTLLQQKKDGDINCKYILQRKPFQWSEEEANRYFCRILSSLPVPEIVLCEQKVKELIIAYLIDGLQRLSYAEAFRNNRIKIGSVGAERHLIEYREYSLDENGNRILDDNGFPTYELKICDVIGKYYKDLPDELKKRFDVFNFNVTKFFNCTDQQIADHLRDYNNHSSMNKEQLGLTKITTVTAGKIKKISEKNMFFKNCCKITTTNETKGKLERVVAEAIMLLFHKDDWKAKLENAYKYVDENATDEEFEQLNSDLNRLELAIGENNKEVTKLFTPAAIPMWVAVFNEFTKYNIEDNRFVDFLNAYVTDLKDRTVDGVSMKTFKSEQSKKRTTIMGKINLLVTLMKDYLHIEEVEETENTYEEVTNEEVTENENNTVEETTEDNVTTKETESVVTESQSEEDYELQFVKEVADPNVEQEDIELYKDFIDDYLKLDSCVYKVGMPVLLALMAYACNAEKDEEFSEWLNEMEKQHRIFTGSEKDNYEKLKAEFLTFLDSHGNKAA